MRCIKERCQYCTEHPYRNSYRVCELSGQAFEKQSSIKCHIEAAILDMEDELKEMRRQKKEVEGSQVAE